jgi:hypothetical protein
MRWVKKEFKTSQDAKKKEEDKKVEERLEERKQKALAGANKEKDFKETELDARAKINFDYTKTDLIELKLQELLDERTKGKADLKSQVLILSFL